MVMVITSLEVSIMAGGADAYSIGGWYILILKCALLATLQVRLLHIDIYGLILQKPLKVSSKGVNSGVHLTLVFRVCPRWRVNTNYPWVVVGRGLLSGGLPPGSLQREPQFTKWSYNADSL